MNITSIMTHKVVVIGVDETLLTVRRMFASARFHHLMVVDKGKICGIISDRDLLKAISPFVGTGTERARDTETLNQKVVKIMSREPITLTEQATVMEAIELFSRHPISCIPIVDAEHRPVGIVSWRDIFRAVLERKSSH